ncbi:Serine/threonine-protein kinase PrkC [Enhygromyxa salina]|uniref:Serine/threonine-protein kinase PrkC n=1 Tax=Enhygromyxa salina TaxID=215803 RepID=A0A2S9XFN9_9BACT|nr:Serine/threonine-protein kinase PrkC [Enhygromyxa salina]
MLSEVRRTRPPHWEKLINQVAIAAGTKIVEPSHPLHQIGRFEAIGTRGVGGFGVVFEARDPELDRRVALKLCQTRGPEAAETLMNEARLLARLTHPNIVTIYEPGRHDDDVFFVMEYVNGVNAHRFSRQDPAPSWERLVDIYRGAGRGLAAAHDAGIVHGDFKPSNVLLDQQLWPRVADFGLAQVMIDHAPDDEQEGLRQRAGTLPYMAPEVLRGQAGGARADQWSFCVSLWESLEDALPYEGWTSGELLAAIEREQPWAMNPEVPEAVRAVLRVGLAEEPSERYPDMHALVAALDGLRQPVVEGRSSPPRRGGFLGAMLLACGVGLGGGMMLGTGPADEPDRATIDPASERRPGGLHDEKHTSLEQVIAAIELGNIEEANATWEAEDRVRALNGAPRIMDDFRVAEAFLAAAMALQGRDSEKSQSAARKAIVWADRTSELLRREQGRGPQNYALQVADAEEITNAAVDILVTERR